MAIDAADTKLRRRARPKRWYAQLWVHVLVGMILGIALGKFYPNAGVRMQPLGDAFIKLIRMLIAPIIFCTVVHGIARMMDMARVGRVALKAILYFEVLTTVALVIGLAAVNLWQPGSGMNVDLAHVDTSAVQTYVAHPQSRERDAVSDEHYSEHICGRVRGWQRAAGAADFRALCGFALMQTGRARQAGGRFHRIRIAHAVRSWWES